MPMKVHHARAIALRELYQEVETGDIYRVVYTGLGQEFTFLAEILGERLSIRRYRTTEFRELSEEGNPRRAYIPYAPDPFSVSERSIRQTPTSLAKSVSNWEILSPLVETYEAGQWLVKSLVDETKRFAILQEYARRSGYKLPLLYKLFRRYLQRGMNEDALRSDYGNCGALRTNAALTRKEGKSGAIESKPIRRQYTKRPGAPPQDLTYQYALPSLELERLICQHLDIYATWRRGVWIVPAAAKALGRRLRERPRYENGLLKVSLRRAVTARLPSKDHRPVRGKRSKPTFQDLADSVNFLLRREISLWDGPRLTFVKLRCTDVVTARQVQWQWTKSLPNFVRRRRRHPGEDTVDRRSPPPPGRARQHVTAPGQLFLLDSTVLDLYVVSALDRRIVLGRPTLYLAVDLFSGLIVGLYLGLENPSREAAALAMCNVVTNKKQFCAEYGLQIAESDWPAQYLPFEIGADRGAEFTSAEPWTGLARQFGIGICNSPVRTPAARGVGERRFGIVTRGFQKAVFGTVERDFGTRTARRYAWDACYTCADVMTMLLRAIDVYHRHPSSGDQPPPVDMVRAGLADTPLNRWNWGVENAGGLLRSVDVEDMRQATWPKARARLYRSGILFRGAWYLCKPLQEEFFDPARGKGKSRSMSVEVQYDPSDMGEVRVALYNYHETATIDPNRNVYPLAGVSLAEWLEIRSANRVNRRRTLLEEQARRFMANHNNQVEDELSAAAQRDALRDCRAKHPDDTDMKGARAKQRQRDRNKNRKGNRGEKPSEQPETVVGEVTIDNIAEDELLRDTIYETEHV
ncbi:Integrase core domain-containing protein [Paraburkholderia steynii]|uniref:Integrase core domain-containing protein n=1 Tax=Paraburkholderia steynii TaxID=1245441 RepID=A0A7Z7FN57_9BURK|nr:Mu transposase C-terminal domain-containing protein [Paraburkholderia steynii]SDJ36082.1 Integrase core domain-containing protein [Paraburkholderia steynii]